MVKNLPANAGATGDSALIPGGGIGNPLQYSCLDNPLDRGAWRAYSPQGHKEADVTEDSAHLKSPTENSIPP